MPWPTYGSALLAAPTERRSRALFHWRASDVSMLALSGHVGALTRAATATGTDQNGTAFTAVDGQPVFERRDFTGSGSRDTMGVFLGTSEYLRFGQGADGATALALVPRAMAGRLEFIEDSGVTGGVLFAISNAAHSGAFLAVDLQAGGYRIRHHNGTSEVNATVATKPSNGERVVLRFQLYSDGSVQLWQSRNGAAETFTSRTGANALASSWGAGTAYVYFNRFGTDGGTAFRTWLRRAKLGMGVPDASALARLF